MCLAGVYSIPGGQGTQGSAIGYSELAEGREDLCDVAKTRWELCGQEELESEDCGKGYPRSVDEVGVRDAKDAEVRLIYSEVGREVLVHVGRRGPAANF